MEKLSPLEQNAAKQLESFDPFSNLQTPDLPLKKYEQDKSKEAEQKKSEPTQHPSGLSRSQRRALYKKHKKAYTARKLSQRKTKQS